MKPQVRRQLVTTFALVLVTAAAIAAPHKKKPAKKPPAPPPPPPVIHTIEDYDRALIDNGVAWKEGSKAYYPSFYVGFAPRMEDPRRIHFHLSRGNQARLTVALDELSVLTYLYSLKARSEAAAAMIKAGEIALIQEKQFNYFNSILASDAYNIKGVISDFESGRITRETFYEKSFSILKTLNPGRVFDIRIDFSARAMSWRTGALRILAEHAVQSGAQTVEAVKAYIGKNAKEALVAANDLVFGRINVYFLTESEKQRLAELAVASASDQVPSAGFVEMAAGFFREVSRGKYDFRVVDHGRYRQALECTPSADCSLVYPEFTAIYPNGSILASVKDRDGNRIPMIRESGVMKFVERAYHDVDHIRMEPYYGFMPKMDYTPSGNGIHNPGVRTYLPSHRYKGVREILHIPSSQTTLWIVSRGMVSHGCTRMGSGHLEEVRQIFPSNPKEMTKVYYTGNASSDYDLFDVRGDGRLEVMGVEYYIAYELVSNSGEGYREAKGLISESFKRDAFYAQLYGRHQYTVAPDGRYVFQNPYLSYFSGKPTDQRASAYSRQMQGEFPLYEQSYEKDKLQFVDLPRYGVDALSEDPNNKTNRAVQIVRLLGRVAACGPFASEFPRCNEAAFAKEMRSLVGSH